MTIVIVMLRYRSTRPGSKSNVHLIVDVPNVAFGEINNISILHIIK